MKPRVNLVTLEPGALSSLRHWHLNEDEFVMVTEGECVMITDAGEEIMRAGDCAAFPAGRPDGHHFINRSDRPARSNTSTICRGDRRRAETENTNGFSC